MEKLKLILSTIKLIACAVCLLLTACSSGVASYRPGQDAAYVNAGRNTNSAKVTSAQSKAYARQRQEVYEEGKFEEWKSQQRTQQWNNTRNTISDILNLANQGNDTFRQITQPRYRPASYRQNYY